MDIDDFQPGMFCWAELATTDARSARAFYTALFGLGTVDQPVGPGMVYTMLQHRGRDVMALYQQGKDLIEKGVPPHFLSYVAVTDVDRTARNAAEIGGKVLVPPFDVMDAGRTAVLEDPTGASFALWQAKKHRGAGVIKEAGSVCWTELATRDTNAASRFYAALLGWEVRGHGHYTEFGVGGEDAAGMMEMDGTSGKAPPHWRVYFAVDSVERSAEKASALGGAVRVPPTDIPRVGRFAVLTDPEGAAFSIIKLEPTQRG